MASADGDDRNVTTSVRMSPELLAELREVAKLEKRTQSAIIEAALEEYLERRESSGLPEELERAVRQYLQRHRQPDKSK